jgi:hypothetical protein
MDQNETSGTTITIHRHLERSKQLRHPLNFVQHYLIRQIGNKPDRVCLRRSAPHIIIKTDIRLPRRIPNLPGQSGFTTLARAMDQDDRRIRQRLRQAREQESGM